VSPYFLNATDTPVLTYAGDTSIMKTQTEQQPLILEKKKSAEKCVLNKHCDGSWRIKLVKNLTN